MDTMDIYSTILNDLPEVFEYSALKNALTIELANPIITKEKREAYKVIESGDADIIIGTHALIQEKVNYNNLTMVVTDEQHRFGVRQREAISEKGEHPHIMVMSATPIPRTLAIIMYGDLDISVFRKVWKRGSEIAPRNGSS
jgi:ATP-dependent DNA helicase RecG